MFYALIILLHRPFVSEGHLSPANRSPTYHAFSLCEDAASRIDTALRCYKKHWCIKSPPYFLSYATYVSATIHVRIAAQKSSFSDAHERLQNCLEILSEHQRVCRAPKRSMEILVGLIRRLNVDIGCEIVSTGDAGGESPSLNDNGVLHMDSGCRQSRDVLNGTPSRSLRSRDKTNTMRGSSRSVGGSTNAPSLHTDLGDSASTFSNDESFGQMNPASCLTGNGMDSLFTDMNFDFDPLFGFDMDQAGFLQDITF